MPHRSLGAVDLLPDGLVATDAHGVVREVNSAAADLIGDRVERLLGSDLAAVLPLQDEDGAPWWQHIDPFAGSGSDGHPERLLFLPDGTGVLVTSRFVRVGEAGQVRSVIVQLRPADDRSPSADPAEVASRPARVLTEVTNAVQVPLGTVLGFARTLSQQWDDLGEVERRYLVSAIAADADRLERLLTDVLDAARSQVGRLEVRPRPVDLGETVRACVDRLVAAVPWRKVQVLVAPQLPLAMADPERFCQLVTNLVENALDHGEGDISVSVDPLPEQGRVRLVVSDQGLGVPYADRVAIFEGRSSGRVSSGHGLGLTIVRGIVKAHDGTIHVDDAPGGGARFTVTIPALGAEAHHPEAGAGAHHPETPDAATV